MKFLTAGNNRREFVKQTPPAEEARRMSQMKDKHFPTPGKLSDASLSNLKRHKWKRRRGSSVVTVAIPIPTPHPWSHFETPG